MILICTFKMGNKQSSNSKSKNSKNENKQTGTPLLLLGLSSSGKTAIQNKIILGDVLTTSHSTGVRSETLSFDNGVELVTWDIGGRDKMRILMRMHFMNTKALVYVIDSSDREKLDDVKANLHRYAKNEKLKECILLILANKKDLPNARSVDQIKQAIDYESLPQKEKNILASCAITGEGLSEGFNWICELLSRQNQSENLITKPLKETVDDVNIIVESQLSKYSWIKNLKKFFHKSIVH